MNGVRPMGVWIPRLTKIFAGVSLEKRLKNGITFDILAGYRGV